MSDNTITIRAAFDACDGTTFANRREYAAALAAILGDGYDADEIAYVCCGFDFDSYDAATRRYTEYRQVVNLEEFAHICAELGPISPVNFFVSTVADFASVPGHPARPADHESESGSRYWYSDEGVVRESDHWGRGVASCDWYLDGGEYGWMVDSTSVCGFCAWDGFTRKYFFD
jgi:hypothetical protein